MVRLPQLQVKLCNEWFFNLKSNWYTCFPIQLIIGHSICLNNSDYLPLPPTWSERRSSTRAPYQGHHHHHLHASPLGLLHITHNKVMAHGTSSIGLIHLIYCQSHPKPYLNEIISGPGTKTIQMWVASIIMRDMAGLGKH